MPTLVNNNVDRIIRQNAKDNYFFERVLWAHMIDSYVRIFSLHM